MLHAPSPHDDHHLHHHLHHDTLLDRQLGHRLDVEHMHPARLYIREDLSPSREATGGEPESTTRAVLTPTSSTSALQSGAVSQSQSPSQLSSLATAPGQQPKMLFSDLYKSPKSPLTKLRNSLPHPLPILPPSVDADLVSRDKAKQKEAVRKFLAEKVRNDWDFTWPPPSEQTSTSSSSANVPAERDPEKAPSSDGAPAAPVVELIPASGLLVEPSNLTPKTNPAAVKAAVVDDAAAPPATTAAAAALASGVVSTSRGSIPDPTPDLNTRPNHEVETPPAKDPGFEADLESDAESIYSTVSEDAAHFRPRAEWTSDLSDSERELSAPHHKPLLSPFRFDSPDSVGAAVKSARQARRARRRRELREEKRWNDGLACFAARRDAWTGARTVRVRPPRAAAAARQATSSPTSPMSPRRLFWRSSHSRTGSGGSAIGGAPLAAVVSAPVPSARDAAPALSPTTTHASNHTEGTSVTPPSSEGDAQQCHRQMSSSSTNGAAAVDCPVQTLLPIPPPLIPAQNPMRASIQPGIYASIYDKVVVHSMQPSCPINLSDMVSSCVVGWKRDGEWPPSSTVAAAQVRGAASGVVVVRRKKSETTTTATVNGHGRKGGSTATNGSRRLSFGGFLTRGGGSAGEKEKENVVKEIKEDESSGKGIRRSLQKVFLGLGHHQNAQPENGAEQQHHHGTKEAAVVM